MRAWHSIIVTALTRSVFQQNRHSEPVTDVTGVRIPRGFKPPNYRPPIWYNVGEIRTIFQRERREGALLLPAAGTDKYWKIPMRIRKMLRIRQKSVNFSDVSAGRSKPLPYG